MTTVRNLPLISGSQNGYATHNTALVEVAAMAFNQITSTLSTPPASPVLHDMYIVGASPTGAWSTFAVGSLAYYNVNNAWQQYVPNTGLLLYHAADKTLKLYNGTTWVNVTIGQDRAVTSTGGTVSIALTDNQSNVLIDASSNTSNIDIRLDATLLTQANFKATIIVYNKTNASFNWNIAMVGGTTTNIASSTGVFNEVKSHTVIKLTRLSSTLIFAEII